MFDSSGTEGESSQQSQRSIVYLHATTVGDIPQPFAQSARRAVSREELSSIRSNATLQPMTKTVSRSVSMLAPWKPKHLHSGYEINYAQGNDKVDAGCFHVWIIKAVFMYVLPLVTETNTKAEKGAVEYADEKSKTDVISGRCFDHTKFVVDQ